MILYCTEPFIITLPSSQYDLIMLKGCKTPNLYHISESFKGVFAQFRESLCKWLRRVVAGLFAQVILALVFQSEVLSNLS